MSTTQFYSGTPEITGLLAMMELNGESGTNRFGRSALTLSVWHPEGDLESLFARGHSLIASSADASDGDDDDDSCDADDDDDDDDDAVDDDDDDDSGDDDDGDDDDGGGDPGGGYDGDD